MSWARAGADRTVQEQLLEAEERVAATAPAAMVGSRGDVRLAIEWKAGMTSGEKSAGPYAVRAAGPRSPGAYPSEAVKDRVTVILSALPG